MTQFAPGCVSLPAWQLWLEQVVAAPFWLGTCSPVHPPCPAQCSPVPYPPDLGLGASDLEWSRCVIGVKLLSVHRVLYH